MFFPSTIIVSSDQSSALTEITRICSQVGNPYQSNNPDLFIVDQNSGWAIDTIRDLTKFFSRRPYQHTCKVAVILDAQKLSTEAQSVLLKTLEEPGEGNYILLTTPAAHSLLATILSRCHIISLVHPAIDPIYDAIIFDSDPKTSLFAVDQLLSNHDKNSILMWLDQKIRYYQHELVITAQTNNAVLVQKLIRCKDMINANVDPKSALDSFFLQ